MIRKNTLYFFTAMALCAIACRSNNENKTTDTELQEVPVVQILKKDTIIHTNYVTAIEARRNVELRAKVQGYLEQIYVDEGQEVKEGQLLFKLNDKEYRLALDKAKANLANMQAEAKATSLEAQRVSGLVNKKIISATELDLAKTRIRSAEAKVAEAQALESEAAHHLSYTAIYAPFSGVIDRIPLRSGSLVTEGALLTTVSDLSTVHAYFNVSENEYLQILQSNGDEKTNDALNSTVELFLSNGNKYAHKGIIKTMEGQIDAGTGSIAFRASFPNPNHLLKHGSTGKIVVTTPVQQVLLVPQKAVFEIQDKNYVYVVEKNNVVAMRNFIPSVRINDYYIVQSGLSNGDNIVLEGVQSIKNGMRIQPKTIQSDSLLAERLK